MNYLRPELLDRLAREYALGTLAGPARRRFERLLRQSSASALAVAVWQERLAGLATHAPPLQPRASVWGGLERRLFAAGVEPAAGKAGPWQWLWHLLSGRVLGGALAGALLCVLLLRLQPGLVGLEASGDALPQSYVGLLTDGAGKPAVLASSTRHGKRLTVKLLQPLAVPPGQVAQLWALPKDGAPFALGVLPGSGSATLALQSSAEKLFFNVPRLAVSLEARPAGAGEQPTGAFVLTGHCVKLW